MLGPRTKSLLLTYALCAVLVLLVFKAESWFGFDAVPWLLALGLATYIGTSILWAVVADRKGGLSCVAFLLLFAPSAHASPERTTLDLLVKHAPPGRTAFSLEPAEDCFRKDSCEGGVFSDFYSAWMRRESAETATRRYERIAQALVGEARSLLCRDEAGQKVEGCVPYAGALTSKGKRRWDVLTLSVAGAAMAMLESGYREDVMVGRGAAKQPSSDGGRGRGPGGEGCLVQAHPLIAWRFADVDEDLRARAEAGNSDAREAVVQSLLGGDPDALARCWRTGLRMLVHARSYCAWASPKTEWDFAMFALYGTGTSCTSINEGKTTLRTRLFRKLLAEARATERARAREKQL